jgi:hypothetical protein
VTAVPFLAIDEDQLSSTNQVGHGHEDPVGPPPS